MSAGGPIDTAVAALRRLADPERAERMAGYLKTDMPFYGVQKPDLVPVARTLAADLSPGTVDEYREAVLELWNLPHREEKYLALDIATRFRRFQVVEALPLYERLIREGAWWDLVDHVAIKLVGAVVRADPTGWNLVDGWIDDADLWLRRSAIICQVGAKQATDPQRLFRFCAARFHEKEFFIRKSIGWALREYAKTDPEAVVAFVTAHRQSMSGLSFREATKHVAHLLEP
jgi:3-methyladenine DNA glycosylase AlkD